MREVTHKAVISQGGIARRPLGPSEFSGPVPGEWTRGDELADMVRLILAEFCRRVATSEIASKNKRREGIQSDVVA